MPVSQEMSDLSGVLTGGTIDRLLGRWSARAIAALSVPYAITRCWDSARWGTFATRCLTPTWGLLKP